MGGSEDREPESLQDCENEGVQRLRAGVRELRARER
jgi:hypothetical protein